MINTQQGERSMDAQQRGQIKVCIRIIQIQVTYDIHLIHISNNPEISQASCLLSSSEGSDQIDGKHGLPRMCTVDKTRSFSHD